MTDGKFTHGPETILFAIDLDSELATEDARGRTRLDVVKHAVTAFVQAKKRMSAQHRFGIITLEQTAAVLQPSSITSSTDAFIDCLLQLQPRDEPQFISSSGSSTSSSNAFDVGSLFTAVAPLLQQQQQHQCNVQQIAGGTISPSPALLNSSSSSSQPQQRQLQQHLRVILIYGRSCLPAPTLATNQLQGLALDCVYVHSKPQEGLNHPQAVYSALEDLVDSMSLKAGHAGFIYETTAGRSMKLLSCMAMLLAHPFQRRPQTDTKPPLDLSVAPLMLLPSDAVNLASGVPIMSPEPLPAASAWSKPLTVTDSVTHPQSNMSPGGVGYGAWGDQRADQSSTSGGVGSAWGASAATAAAASTAAAAGTAAAPNPWSDPWDDASSTAAFGGGNVLLLEQTLPASTTKRYGGLTGATDGVPGKTYGGGGGGSSSGGACSSSSQIAPGAVAIGVPADIVPGIPDRRPSYSFDDSIAMGFAVPDQGSREAQNLGHGGGSSSSYNPVPASTGGGRSAAGRDAGVDDDNLDNLAAVLRATAIDETRLGP